MSARTPTMVAVLLVALVVPPAGAEAQTEVTFDVTFRLPDMPDEVVYATADAYPQDLDGCREPGNISRPPIGTGFRFQETAEGEGCAEAIFDVSVPEGATTARVSFRADRSVSGTSVADPRMRQELWVHGTTVDIYPVFDPFQGTSLSEDRSFDIVVPQRSLRLGWFFSDEGETERALVTMPARNQMFSASVDQHEVTFPDIHADVQAVGDDTESLDTLTDVQRRTYQTEVPDFGAQHTVLVFHGDRPATITGPEGQVPLTSLAAAEDGWRLSATPGTYTFVTEHLVTSHPVLFQALPLMVFATVLGSTGMATWSHWRWSTHAHREQRLIVRIGWAWLAAAIVVVVVLAAWSFGPGTVVMREIPLANVAWSAYLSLALLAVALAATSVHGLVQRRAAVELHHRDALRDANQRLERSNRDLEEFAAIASHDLQAPLRRIVGCTQLLERQAQGHTPPEAQELMSVVVQNGLHMQRLVADILDLSRIQHKELHCEPVALAPMFDHILFDLQPEIEAGDVRVQVRVDGQVSGSPSMLREVFHNLVVNAVKYRCDSEPRVEIRSWLDGKTITVAVRDNGRGIAPEEQERVFQMFHRSRNVGDATGNGIGLAVARRIVELHGGEIAVASEVGRGSTFTVRLPVA